MVIFDVLFYVLELFIVNVSVLIILSILMVSSVMGYSYHFVIQQFGERTQR